MSTLVGDRLPPAVLAAFDGERLSDKVGLGYLLVTTDPDGTPRPCMLSCGEILAVDDRRLRLALWAGTHTAANLSLGTTCLFCYVAPGSVLYVKGTLTSLGTLERHHVECFDLVVASVEADDHPGMPASDTFRFVVMAQAATEVVAEWEERLADLRRL
jgi:hypothetical protein